MKQRLVFSLLFRRFFLPHWKARGESSFILGATRPRQAVRLVPALGKWSSSSAPEGSALSCRRQHHVWRAFVFRRFKGEKNEATVSVQVFGFSVKFLGEAWG